MPLVSATPPPWEPPSRPDTVAADPSGGLPEATWAWWEAVLAYVTSMVVAAVPLLLLHALFNVDLLGDSGPSYVALLVAGELAFFVTVLFWIRVIHRTPLAILGRLRRPLRDLAVGIPTGMLLFVASVAVSVLIDVLYRAVTGHPPPSPDQVPDAVAGVWLAWTGVGVVLLAPLGEETLFRGFLYRGLRRRLAPWPAAVVSGALFGLGHLQGWSFLVLVPPLFVVGVGLAVVYERRQSLLASMAAHGTFNVIGFVFLLASRR
jgi:membrane protease YdiL (CAAX protease family)